MCGRGGRGGRSLGGFRRPGVRVGSKKVREGTFPKRIQWLLVVRAARRGAGLLAAELVK